MEQKEKTLAKDKLEFVSGIITNKDGNVLLLKRNGNLKLDPSKYDFCSGHIKEGEIPLQSMYRELHEEIGLEPHQIKKIEQVGTIETPHSKLKNTLTHIYDIQIDLSIEKINEMIKSVPEPEMEKAFYLKDINTLRTVIEEMDNCRMNLTYEVGIVLEVIEKRVNKRKEENLKGCEER